MFMSRSALGLCVLLAAVPASAQYIDGSPPPLPVAPLGGERPSDALARYVRVLAQSPRDYRALVGAGRAALDTGDAEAAVGFFGRAADVSPNAPAPKAGMGAALVAMGEAGHALTEFDRAARAGAPVSSYAADRGLARDLLGQQALAQADYTLGLAGPDPDEARRRLALSQAISGNRAAAIATLAPLAGRRDGETARARAFVDALVGDVAAADRSLDATMPGMSSRLDPFFRRLAGLTAAEKAAAVHLGIMPSNGTVYSSSIPSSTVSPSPPTSTFATIAPRRPVGPRRDPALTDRLGGIDALLREPTPAPVQGPPVEPLQQVARVRIPSPPPAAIAPAAKRIWVQLASGLDERALGGQFAKLAARKPELFEGIRPFVAEVDGRTKLLVGPFKDRENSEIFLDELAADGISSFSWTSPEGQPVRKLVSQ